MSLDIKLERVARLCRETGVGGIVLNTQANFAWITDGRSNRIDDSRELGAGAILVTANGRRFVIANAIEMPRLCDEALAGIPCEPVEYPWTDDHARPDTIITLAREAAGSDAIGADWPLPGAVVVERNLARARAPLTSIEVEKYRVLGRDVGDAVGQMCRGLEPGAEEHDIARLAADAVAGVRARSIVTLIAADGRIRRYRHPVPTDARWQHLVMVVVCAQRDGLVVSLTRLVCAGAPPQQLIDVTSKTGMVFGELLGATREGATGRHLYDVASRAYREQGFAGEERRHHQGGATGYRSREWLAHPASEEEVHAPQAFAWNPSITGTKVEETALVTDAGVEIITSSGGWPSFDVAVNGVRVTAPGILRVA